MPKRKSTFNRYLELVHLHYEIKEINNILKYAESSDSQVENVSVPTNYAADFMIFDRFS